MKLTDLFVKRPVLAAVVNLVILIAGLRSIRSLSVRQYPRSDSAVVQVTTIYVGANANLVRGFITSPLERVVASADGIDYIESSSAQGVSTITVHLKLNYDTNAALTQIQAKVAQVRNDLPPEAQAPIIDLQTADNQFASMYLGFGANELDQNQITDYLVRVVQPKLTAISGVQRADILGDRTLRHARVAEAREDGGPRDLLLAGERCPRRQQLPLGARARPRGPWSRSTSSPTRTCRRRTSSASSWSSKTRASSCAWATSPTSSSGPRTTTRTSASTARPPPSWGSGFSRRPTRSR